MTPSQESLDTRALETANEARTLVLEHLKACGEERKNNREDRAEMWRAIRDHQSMYSEKINRVHTRLDRLMWIVIGIAIASGGTAVDTAMNLLSRAN